MKKNNQKKGFTLQVKVCFFFIKDVARPTRSSSDAAVKHSVGQSGRVAFDPAGFLVPKPFQFVKYSAGTEGCPHYIAAAVVVVFASFGDIYGRVLCVYSYDMEKYRKNILFRS